MKCSDKNDPQLLIITVDNIYCDEFLDDINILLNTADLSDMYSTEEKSNILNKMMDTIHEEVHF